MTHAQLLDAHVSPACIFSHTTVVSVIIDLCFKFDDVTSHVET